MNAGQAHLALATKRDLAVSAILTALATSLSVSLRAHGPVDQAFVKH
jgi:hypothetical protein